WIHVDTERAKTELPQGKTIAHGFLTLSLLSLLLKQAVVVKIEFKRGINYGFNRVRFPSPVPAGSQIRVRCTLVAVEEIPNALQICWAVTMDVKDVSKPALVAEWLVRYYRQLHSAGSSRCGTVLKLSRVKRSRVKANSVSEPLRRRQCNSNAVRSGAASAN